MKKIYFSASLVLILAFGEGCLQAMNKPSRSTLNQKIDLEQRLKKYEPFVIYECPKNFPFSPKELSCRLYSKKEERGQSGIAVYTPISALRRVIALYEYDPFLEMWLQEVVNFDDLKFYCEPYPTKEGICFILNVLGD